MQRLVSVTCPGGEGVDGARRDVGEGLKPRDRQGREQTHAAAACPGGSSTTKRLQSRQKIGTETERWRCDLQHAEGGGGWRKTTAPSAGSSGQRQGHCGWRISLETSPSDFLAQGGVGRAPRSSSAEKLLCSIRILYCKCLEMSRSMSAFPTPHRDAHKYLRFTCRCVHTRACTSSRKSRHVTRSLGSLKFPIKGEKTRKGHPDVPAPWRGGSQQ